MPRVSFSIVPAEPEYAELVCWIADLAETYHGPLFIPHLTALAGAELADDDARCIGMSVAESTKRFPLTVCSLEFSSKFTKTCYLQCAHSDLLQALSHGLAERGAPREQYVLNPHLSLFYGSLDQSARAAIQARSVLPKLLIAGELMVVSAAGKTETAADVAAWNVVGRFPFREGR